MGIHIQNEPDDSVFHITPGLRSPLFPAEAPRLHTNFVTAAGLDRLMPFDWLPAGVPVLNNRGTHLARADKYCIMPLLMLAGQMPAFRRPELAAMDEVLRLGASRALRHRHRVGQAGRGHGGAGGVLRHAGDGRAHPRGY